ncbi:tryptophan-rich sensory protein [Deinococcus psychrotolerans]|uniref:Tryptophan-rich sensory protein n=1 Tax=Deinococcus psychrotolerans TaxID=2489213 RepID=A0A3G8YL83_9DEIO|nr:TspO/MBR family protein [Deinococcus psychrotolerans]AZI42341.1 tryptophan-rich sensory protein [Deinococcus psychrotolerans]
MIGIRRQITLVLATLLTLLMNYLSNALPLFGNSNGEISDLLPNAFTPAGLTFAIWGVIFLGLLAFAVYQALPGQRGPRYDALFWPYLLANLLNVGWLVAFQSLHFGLSVVVMLALLGSLIWLYLRLKQLDLKGTEALALGLPTSLYLGWIAVATIANVTAWLVSLGFTAGLAGISGPLWSAILVVVASGVGAFLLRANRDFAVMGVILWAYYGVYLARPQELTVTLGLVLGVVVLLTAAFAQRGKPGSGARRLSA